MDFQALTAMLGSRIGLRSDGSAGSGAMSLLADGDLSMTVEPAGPDSACFLAELGPLPAVDPSATLARLLRHNLEQRRNSGSFLSLDPRQDMMVLCRRVSAADYASFESEFESFVDEAIQLRKRFGAAEPTREQGAVPDLGWALSGIRV